MKVQILAKAGAKLTEKLGPLSAALVKKSPAIFTGSGVALLVGANVMTGWATVKAKAIAEEPLEKTIVVYADDEKFEHERSDAEMKRVAIAKFAKMAGYFAPSVIMTGVGIGFVVHGHSLQETRIAGAMAAYSTLSTAFSNYRSNVIEDRGEEADARYMYGDRKAKADIYEEPEEEGKKPKKHKETVVLRERMPGSPYAVIFDDVSPDWVNNRNQNLFFLQCQETTANNMLRRRGYLFLNELLELLGLPYNPAGQFVGWIDEAYEGSVHGIVELGINYAYLEAELERAQLEERNPEPSIWLDPNVDGEIWDKIPLVRKRGMR